MKRLLTLAAIILSGALVFSPTVTTACDGLADLTVEVRTTDDVLVASTVTDDEGHFSIDNLELGSYLLKIYDNDLLYVSLGFSVPAEEAPARLRGEVSSDDDEDISLEVEGEVYAMEDADDDVEVARLRLQRRWNSRWTRSHGWTLVRIRGMGMRNVTSVSLTSAKGKIETTKIRSNYKKARAFFKKSQAYSELIPDDAEKGDTVDITVSVTTPVGTQDFSRTIRIVGRHGRHK